MDLFQVLGQRYSRCAIYDFYQYGLKIKSSSKTTAVVGTGQAQNKTGDFSPNETTF